MAAVKHALPLALAALLGPGCGVAPSGSELASSEMAAPVLGEAYEVWTDDLKNTSCITWDEGAPSVVAPKLGELKYEMNASFKDIADAISGRARLALNMQSFEVDGEVSFASDFRNSEYVSSITVVQRFDNGYVRLPTDGRVRLNATGRALAGRDDLGAFRETCGSHYVTEYDLSGSLVGSLVFQFGSLSDKMAFDAKIKVELAGIGGGNAAVKTMLEKGTEKMSIRFKAHQRGGIAGRLGNAMNAAMAACDAKSRQHCYEAFETFVEYASRDFPSQFQVDGRLEPSRFVKQRYEIRPYDSLGEPALVCNAPTEGQLMRLKVVRGSTADAIVNETADRNLVLAYARSDFTADDVQRDKLQQLAARIDTRIGLYKAALLLCYQKAEEAEHKLLECEEAVRKARATAVEKHPYDLSGVVFYRNTLGALCGNLQTWHDVYFSEAHPGEMASTVMDEDTREAVVTILNTGALKAVAGLGRQVVIDVPATAAAGTVTPNDPTFSCAAYEAQAHTIAELSLAGRGLHNIEALSTLPYLRTLDLSYNRLAGGVRAVAAMSHIESMKLVGSGLQSLEGLGVGTLRDLDLSNNDFFDDELAKLAGARALAKLDVGQNPYLASLAMLPSLRKLRRLVVTGTGIEKAALESFLRERVQAGQFPMLREIVASGTACQAAHETAVEVQCGG